MGKSSGKGKGGKNRRRGKNDNSGQKRELIYKEEGQEYAQITKMLGNGRIEVSCFDGIKRMGHIRGKLRKKVWMGQGDIILVSLRDFQDDQCDVVHKYNSDEARTLKMLVNYQKMLKLMKLILLVVMMMKMSISNSVEPMKMKMKKMKN